MNKIVQGPFLDCLISDYLKIPYKNYSTNASEALILLSKLVDDTPSGFSINFIKQLNSQNCKVSLFRRNINYEAESGYLPMSICLLFINSWSKHLRFYSFEFLKLQWEKYQIIQLKENEGLELTDEEIDLSGEFHSDFPELFNNLSDNQIEALVEYANQ